MADPVIRNSTNLQGIIQSITQAGPAPSCIIREADPGDLAALVAIENQCFAIDRIARPGLRRFLAQEPTSAPQGNGIPHRLSRTLVVEQGADVCGYAIILFAAKITLQSRASIP